MGRLFRWVSVAHSVSFAAALYIGIIGSVLDKCSIVTSTSPPTGWSAQSWSRCHSFEIFSTLCLLQTNITGLMHTSYLSFLLHLQDFRKPNFTPKKTTKGTKNTKNVSEKVKYMHFFHSIWKNLHLTENFYTDMSVVSVTNMRYVFFLWIYFQLALHVSALRPWSHAVAYCTKTKGARLNFTFTSTFTSESESKIHTNRSLQRSSHGKNWFPQEWPGSLPNCPSPPMSSWSLHAEIFLLLCRH